MKSSHDLVGSFDLFSVNEFHEFNNLGRVRKAMWYSPVLLRTFTKFVRVKVESSVSEVS